MDVFIGLALCVIFLVLGVWLGFLFGRDHERAEAKKRLEDQMIDAGVPNEDAELCSCGTVPTIDWFDTRGWHAHCENPDCEAVSDFDIFSCDNKNKRNIVRFYWYRDKCVTAWNTMREKEGNIKSPSSSDTE